MLLQIYKLGSPEVKCTFTCIYLKKWGKIESYTLLHHHPLFSVIINNKLQHVDVKVEGENLPLLVVNKNLKCIYTSLSH